MKNKLLLILVWVVAFIFFDKVYAASYLRFECERESYKEGNTAYCDVNVYTDAEKVTSVSFQIDTGVLKYDIGSNDCDSFSFKGNTANLGCSKDYGYFVNGDRVAEFKIKIPRDFLNMDYPINLSNISISDSNHEGAESDTHEGLIKINGKYPYDGNVTKSLELKCPNYYVGNKVTCDLILNLNSCYYDSIEFKYDMSQVLYASYYGYSYKIYGEDDFDKGHYFLYLGNRETPFVGKSVVASLTFNPKLGNNNIKLTNIILGGSDGLHISSGKIYNGSLDGDSMDDVVFNYTGVERQSISLDLSLDLDNNDIT